MSAPDISFKIIQSIYTKLEPKSESEILEKWRASVFFLLTSSCPLRNLLLDRGFEMSLNGCMTFLRGRLSSKTFLGLFCLITSLFIFDEFVESYILSSVPLVVEQQVSWIFVGQGVLALIYVGAIAEALGLSVLVGFISKLLHVHRSS